MQPDEADRSYLLDMLQHAEGVIGTVGAVSLEQYASDENLRMATERRIEIVGEAACRVSDEFQAAHSEIPWRKIIAQRHILAHEYGDVDDELIWTVATVHIPVLVTQLRAALS